MSGYFVVLQVIFALLPGVLPQACTFNGFVFARSIVESRF